MEVGDAGRVEDAGQLELRMGAEVVEQRAAGAEQDPDQVDLELVEHPGAQAGLRELGPVDEHVAFPAASLARAIARSTPSVT